MKKLKTALLTALAGLSVSGPVRAEMSAEQADFVSANILTIFYHELAHAVIDLMDVPIFGQEEDAADVMAVLLVDALFEEETAQALAYDSSFGFINDPEGKEEIAFWDVHGPDEQRYFNHVCLFFGANPEEREDLAIELGLPEERAMSCPEEFELAAESWGPVLEEMEGLAGQAGITLEKGAGEAGAFINGVLESEIGELNKLFGWPEPLRVAVQPCDEPNAYYDPEARSITICEEFVPYLAELFTRF